MVDGNGALLRLTGPPSRARPASRACYRPSIRVYLFRPLVPTDHRAFLVVSAVAPGSLRACTGDSRQE